jgi:hypothetical protein
MDFHAHAHDLRKPIFWMTQWIKQANLSTWPPHSIEIPVNDYVMIIDDTLGGIAN